MNVLKKTFSVHHKINIYKQLILLIKSKLYINNVYKYIKFVDNFVLYY